MKKNTYLKLFLNGAIVSTVLLLFFAFSSAPVSAQRTISPKPTISVYANPKIVDKGGTSNVTWNSIGAKSCFAANIYADNTQNVSVDLVSANGVDVGPLTKDRTVSIYCLNADGVKSDTASVTIKVNPPDPVINSFTASSPSSKTSGSSITVTPGSSVTLSWSVTGANYCRGVGDSAWTGTKQNTTGGQTFTGNQTLNNITESKTYALVCDNQTIDLQTQESPASYVYVTVASGNNGGNGNGGGNNNNNNNSTPPGPTGLVPCTGTSENPCTWDSIMKLINKVVNFILFTLAVPLAAIMFAYAGGLLMFSGGEASKRTQAKKIIINVAIGLVIAAGAWVIVHTVLSIVGYDGSWIGF